MYVRENIPVKLPSHAFAFSEFSVEINFHKKKRLINWDKVFKSGISIFCGRQSLKKLLSPILNTLSQLFLPFGVS